MASGSQELRDADWHKMSHKDRVRQARVAYKKSLYGESRVLHVKEFDEVAEEVIQDASQTQNGTSLMMEKL